MAEITQRQDQTSRDDKDRDEDETKRWNIKSCLHYQFTGLCWMMSLRDFPGFEIMSKGLQRTPSFSVHVHVLV